MKNSVICILAVFLCSKPFAQSITPNLVFATFSNEVVKPAKFISLHPATKEVSAKYLNAYIKRKESVKAVLGYTKKKRAVGVHYFPGVTGEKVLIIGGMHGSELSSVELAKTIIQHLEKGVYPYYDVLIIPELFPDNVAFAQSVVKTKNTVNAGRYTTRSGVDPNRQMPTPGKPFNETNPIDANGRLIEMENQYLLQLIQEHKPSHIINLHAIRDVSKAGIYADPRTDCKGFALGFEPDSVIAVSIAMDIYKKGGCVTGNNLSSNPTALYYKDPLIAPAGTLQKRNLHGSLLPGNRGNGVSLGTWASTSVCENDMVTRNASSLITIEFPGYNSSNACDDSIQKRECLLNIRLYSAAIINFLCCREIEPAGFVKTDQITRLTSPSTGCPTQVNINPSASSFSVNTSL